MSHEPFTERKGPALHLQQADPDEPRPELEEDSPLFADEIAGGERFPTEQVDSNTGRREKAPDSAEPGGALEIDDPAPEAAFGLEGDGDGIETPFDHAIAEALDSPLPLEAPSFEPLPQAEPGSVSAESSDEQGATFSALPPLAAPPGPQSFERQPHVRPGLFSRLFGGGHRVEDAHGALVRYEQKPGLLRVFARRNYQREAALASMRAGFNDLSDLMRDIRDGLHASVERQGELLDHLKYLPIVAEQNHKAAERFEEQSQSHARLQAQTIRTIREQIRGQQEHQQQISSILGTMNRESRDHKRDIDDLEGRLERMRQNDEAIAHNLSSVGAAVRRVSEHGSAQSELVLRMQESFDDRTRHLEGVMRRQATRQGIVVAVTLLLALAALGAVAAVGFLYLRQTGAL